MAPTAFMVRLETTKGDVMIEIQRAYEVNSKMIKSTDEMLQYVNQQL